MDERAEGKCPVLGKRGQEGGSEGGNWERNKRRIRQFLTGGKVGKKEVNGFNKGVRGREIQLQQGMGKPAPADFQGGGNGGDLQSVKGTTKKKKKRVKIVAGGEGPGNPSEVQGSTGGTLWEKQRQER